MNVLHNERERTFAPIALARLDHGAGRQISPERLVVRAAVVVTGHSKPSGRPKNQQRRRENKPAWPPARFRYKPAVWRVDEHFRRIKRRDVIANEIIPTL